MTARRIALTVAAMAFAAACTLLLAAYVVGSGGTVSPTGFGIAAMWAAATLTAMWAAATNLPHAIAAARSRAAQARQR